MYIEILIIIAKILGLIAVILESKLLLYTMNKAILLRLGAYSKYMILTSILIASIILIIDNSILPDTIYIGLYFIIFIITRYFIYYGSGKDNFYNFDEIVGEYDRIAEKEPEMIVVSLKSHPLVEKNIYHIIPSKLLLVNDLVLTATNLSSEKYSGKYSLTFCTMCNTVHAYVIPIIDGKTILIDSQKGGVLNGNKILTNKSGTIIWQQYNGKPIKGTQIELFEMNIMRMDWKHVKDQFKDAKFYLTKINPIIYFIFKRIRWLAKNVDVFAFSKGGENNSLPKKSKVVGVNLLSGSKAYPYSQLEIGLIEDSINNTAITLFFNGHGTIGFYGHGYTLSDNLIIKDNKKWDLTGISLDSSEDLQLIPLTDHMYWYLWNQFNPDTEIYIKSK